MSAIHHHARTYRQIGYPPDMKIALPRADVNCFLEMSAPRAKEPSAERIEARENRMPVSGAVREGKGRHQLDCATERGEPHSAEPHERHPARIRSPTKKILLWRQDIPWRTVHEMCRSTDRGKQLSSDTLIAGFQRIFLVESPSPLRPDNGPSALNENLPEAGVAFSCNMVERGEDVGLHSSTHPTP